MRLLPTILTLCLTITGAMAQPLRVVTDIAPVHSLVALVMGDTATPTLLIRPSDQPHDVQLRPSQARALANANAVFWVGPALTPWLGDALDSLATDARITALLTIPGTPDTRDPHTWLNPDTAQIWLRAIAEVLAALDPENENRYRTNATAATADIDRLTASLEQTLSSIRGQNLIFAHDAYSHFTARFGLSVSGSLSGSNAAPPGATRLRNIRDLLRSGTIACAFLETGQNPRQLRSLIDGTSVQIAALDPTGMGIEPGSGLYRKLMENLARDMANCVNE